MCVWWSWKRTLRNDNDDGVRGDFTTNHRTRRSVSTTRCQNEKMAPRWSYSSLTNHQDFVLNLEGHDPHPFKVWCYCLVWWESPEEEGPGRTEENKEFNPGKTEEGSTLTGELSQSKFKWPTRGFIATFYFYVVKKVHFIKSFLPTGTDWTIEVIQSYRVSSFTPSQKITSFVIRIDSPSRLTDTSLPSSLRRYQVNGGHFTGSNRKSGTLYERS